jgi:hypothetical protein
MLLTALKLKLVALVAVAGIEYCRNAWFASKNERFPNRPDLVTTIYAQGSSNRPKSQ